MMRYFKLPDFKATSEKIIALKSRGKDLGKDELIYRVMPQFLLELLCRYFRLEVTGVEHLPRRGAALIAPNHSGYSGLDSLLLTHEIHRATGRVPRTLTHRFWFLSKATAIPAAKVGFVKATMENGLAQLRKKNLVVVFPEGETGNFKPSIKRYRLQDFKTGFVRMALRQQAPIIPTLIIGAEETHINLSQLKFSGILRGASLPLPLNLVPLPAKWRIVFLPPIHLPYKPEAADDPDLVSELTADIRERMQAELSLAVARRGSIF